MRLLLRLTASRVGLVVLTGIAAFTAYAIALKPAWVTGLALDAYAELVAVGGPGVVAMALWGLIVLNTLLSRPLRLLRRWRIVLGTLAALATALGALSFVDRPLPLLGEVNWGGEVGALVRGPDVAPGIARVGVFALATAWLLVPVLMVRGLRLFGRGSAAALAAPAEAYQRTATQREAAGRSVGRAAGSAVSAGVIGVGRGIGAVRRRRAERQAGRLSKDVGDFFATTYAPAPGTLTAPAQVVESPLPDDDEDDAPAVRPQPAPRRRAAVAAPEPEPEPAPTPRATRSGRAWRLPDTGVLAEGSPAGAVTEEHHATARLIEETLAQHGVEVRVAEIRPGPSITMFGLVPGWMRRGRARVSEGEDDPARNRVKVDSILAREKDLALALAAPSLRLEAPVPGESVVGVEVPNKRASGVTLRSVMDTPGYRDLRGRDALPVALGLAAAGEPVAVDLTRMPHLLIAGATGSGKSVCMNGIISSLIAHQPPDRLRMLLVDPKRVELTPYNGIPHLVTPVVTDPDKVVRLLRGAIAEMGRRYKLLEEAGVRNIASYNRKVAADEQMPYFVIGIDELADLMMTASFDVEQSICRLAQLGRATGIHLVVATQRPSVDVVTGLIKANFPSRIAFAVASQVDSRTILDLTGAERLLGRGDMLFLSNDAPKPRRVQGAYIGDEEIEALAGHWRAHPPLPLPGLDIEAMARAAEVAAAEAEASVDLDDADSLYDRALQLAAANRVLSTSLLQRRLRIGYPRAARLMDQLEEEGIIGASAEPGKPREVLYHPDD
jgi:S-DNA-T family DNA segregation ATPase FtsK/SpoIIIE